MRFQAAVRSWRPVSFLVLATFLLTSCYGTVSRAPGTGPDHDTEHLSGLILGGSNEQIDLPLDSDRRWKGDELVVTTADPTETRRYSMEEIEQLQYRELREAETVGLTTLILAIGAAAVAISTADLAPDLAPAF